MINTYRNILTNGRNFSTSSAFLYRMNFIINHKTGCAKGLFTNKYFRHESFLPLPCIIN
nr:MAG TPA: hypothetical protein [Caudoviricetes sp.]